MFTKILLAVLFCLFILRIYFYLKYREKFKEKDKGVFKNLHKNKNIDN